VAMATPESGPPRGTRDLLPQIVERREAVTSSIAETYASFGFRRIETPSIEAIERLAAGQGGENEKLIYRILRRGLAESVEAGTTLSELTDLGLRFDLTVPLTRYYANNHAQLPTPFRALQIGNVWRAERPAKGRYRQFTQCDIDVVGEPSVLVEAELLEATTTALTDLGISAMTVRLNDRRLLSAVAQECAIPEANRAALFVSLDKLDKLGWEAVNRERLSRALTSTSCAPGRPTLFPVSTPWCFRI
jgi:histidyl-tRNA synthetase